MPSSPQTVTTRGVFDYLYNSAGKAIVGATVNCTLNFNGASVTSPIVNLGELQQTTVTDQNGFWRFNLVPNDTITPTGTLYTIQSGNIASYDISVPSGGADVQSSSILANTPSVLSPAVTNLTGPITVTGNEIVTGTLTVGGTISNTPLTTGQVVFPSGGILSGDANHFWDNTNKRLGIGTATPTQALDVTGNVQIKGGQPWFDVKAFGAKGDGTTDDTTAIQNAVNAASGSGIDGLGIVYFPPPNVGQFYKVTGVITNPATLLTGLGFIGAGREVSIVTQTTQNTDLFRLAGSGAGGKLSNVFFQDMSIRGPNAGTSGFGINCNGDLELYRVWVQFHWTAVRITNGAYMHFEDSGLFSSVQDGLFLDTLNFNFESRGTRYSGNGRYGIFSPNAVNMMKIAGGTCESNATRGMHLDGASTGLVIRDVYFENQGAGVTEQIFLGPTAAPLAPAVLDCHFTNTTAVNCKHIHVFSAANAIIAGNYIGTTGASGTGISLDVGCTSALVMNNQNNASTVDSGTNTTILQPSGLINLGGFISLRGGGGAPTLGALQTNISTQTISGGNNAFLVTVTTGGAAPGAGAIVAIVSFSSTFAVAPVVVVKTNTAIAADHDFAATDITTGGFNLRATNALNATQAYPISILAFGK